LLATKCVPEDNVNCECLSTAGEELIASTNEHKLIVSPRVHYHQDNSDAEMRAVRRLI